MTPDQAKLKSVHRLKWMLSNGFWELVEQTLSKEFCRHIHTLSWSMCASEPLAIQETHPSCSPQSETDQGNSSGPAPEIHQIIARNPSDVHQESIRCAPGIHQMCTRNIASLLPFDPPLDSKSFFKSSCMAAKAVSILLLLEAISLNSKEGLTDSSK